MARKHSKTEALKIIKRIVNNGSVITSAHLKQRMRERDFDMHDILFAIKMGNIHNEPEIHPKTGNWIYVIEGKTIDGDKIKIQIDIDDENNQIILVTGIIN